MWIAWVAVALGQDFTEHVLSTGFVPFPDDVAIADLDGDGDPDGVALSDEGLAWYENDGTGAFVAHDLDYAGRTVSVGDIDGDGQPDLLIGTILLTAASGWTSRADLSGESIPPDPLEAAGRIADLDGDGDDDYVVVVGNTLRIRGAGSTDPDYLVEASDVLAADVDGNGFVDVVTASLADAELGWIPQTAAGFGAWARIGALPPGGRVTLAAADLRGSPELEIVVGGESGAVFYTLDAGTWQGPQLLDDSGPAWPRVVDVDEDGVMDVLLRSGAWVRREGSGVVRELIPGPLRQGPAAAADLNRDGTLDVLGAQASAGWIAGVAKPGSVAWGAVTLVDGPLCGGTAATIQDVTRDGVLDLVVATRCDGEVVAFAGTASPALSFAAPAALLAPPAVVTDLAAADLDGDGLSDLAVTTDEGRTVIVTGTVAGLGAPVQVIAPPGGARELHLATRAGAPALVGRVRGSVSLIEHDGAEYTVQTLPLASDTPILPRDTSGDGDTDELLSGSPFLDRYVWDGASWSLETFLLPVAGTGWSAGLASTAGGGIALASEALLYRLPDPEAAFGEPLSAKSGLPGTYHPGAATLTAADLTGDGADELLVGHAEGGVVVIDPPLMPRPERLGRGRPHRLLAADLDGDTDVDLVKLDAGGRLSWFENGRRTPGEAGETGDTGAPPGVPTGDTGPERPSIGDDDDEERLPGGVDTRGCGCVAPGGGPAAGWALAIAALLGWRRRR